MYPVNGNIFLNTVVEGKDSKDESDGLFKAHSKAGRLFSHWSAINCCIHSARDLLALVSAAAICYMSKTVLR